MAKEPKLKTPKAAAPVAPAEKETPIVKQPQQHGVTRPKSGTATGKVWDTIDSMLVDGVIPRRKDVIEKLQAEGMNVATVSTQYGKYRKFHGLGPEPKETKVDAPTNVAPNAAEGMPEAVETESSAEEDELEDDVEEIE